MLIPGTGHACLYRVTNTFKPVPGIALCECIIILTRCKQGCSSFVSQTKVYDRYSYMSVGKHLLCLTVYRYLWFVNNLSRQRIYHVVYTSSHSNTEVKQHWAWILIGWETLQGIPGSAGPYPPTPYPLRTEYSLFRLSLSQSSDWDLPKQKKNILSLLLSNFQLSLCSTWSLQRYNIFLYTKVSYYFTGITIY